MAGARRSPAGPAAALDRLRGMVRVVAGAGTGKTAVIVDRYRQLIEAGVRPDEILVMTFSERAATEMRNRILAATGLEQAPGVGTFHATALRWLREEGSRLGIHPGFSLLTGAERWIFMRELMWELGHPALVGSERPDDLVGSLLGIQERIKQELIPISRLRAWIPRAQLAPDRRSYFEAAAQLFTSHRRRTRAQRLLDFDDLLAEAVALFQAHPDLLARQAGRQPWLMVDEYQDTNLAQERLVELLGRASGNVLVVGDDDQSIYRFRGASRANLDRFQHTFPAAMTQSLAENRRSTRTVVEAARCVIEQAADRIAKPLTASRPDGEPVQVWRLEDGEAEAVAVVDEIERLVGSGIGRARIAILVRTHALAAPVVRRLGERGVAFEHRTGLGFYRRPEVLDLVALLRLLDDPTDLIALARLAARPPHRADLEALMEVVRDGAGRGLSPLAAAGGWEPLADWAETIAELVPARTELGVDDLLFELLSRTRHLDHLVAANPAQGGRMAANVARFAELVAEYCERRRDHSLHLFVEHQELVLASGVDEAEAAEERGVDAVQVLSIHQAKGLEFDAVFMPAMVEGRMPQARHRDPLQLPAALIEASVRGREDHLAEERRLCYVAMTRARDRLYLSWAPAYEGSRAWKPSRFLAEMGAVGEDRVVEMALGGRSAGDLCPELAPASKGADDPRHSKPVEAGPTPTLSFSAVSSYLECPRQYRFRHRLRLPARPSVEAQLGTIVHLVLMRAGRLRAQGREIDALLLGDLLAEAFEEVPLVEPRRGPALEALGRLLLASFLEDGGFAGAPHLVEHVFTADLDGWRLRGIIDRVDPPPTHQGGGWAAGRGSGGREERGLGGEAAGAGGGQGDPAAWRIIDYKTGGPGPGGRWRRDLQLALYALGARRSLGLEPIQLELVYLRDRRRVVLAAGDELLAEAEAAGREVAEGVLAGRFDPRPERRRCRLCAYRLACDAAL